MSNNPLNQLFTYKIIEKLQEKNKTINYYIENSYEYVQKLEEDIKEKQQYIDFLKTKQKLDKDQIERQMDLLIELKKEKENNLNFLNSNRKILNKMDFVKDIIVMCDLIYGNILDLEERKKNIRNIIGKVQAELVLGIEKIEDLRKISYIIEKWRKTRDGELWIKDTIYDWYIENIDKWKRERIDKVKHELAKFLAIPDSKLDSHLAEDLITGLHIRKIFNNYIMQIIFINSYGDNYYIFDDKDMPIGKSGIKHYFTGALKINVDNIGTTSFLVKCDSIGPSALKVIQRTKTTLEDCGYKKSVIFSSTYPSSSALKMENYLERTHGFDLTVLYLHDLYEMIKIVSKHNIKEYMEKRVRL